MVGNLLYVDLDLNEELGSKGFPEKQNILVSAKGVWVDEFIHDASGWGKQQIEQRTLELAARTTIFGPSRHRA